MEEKYEEIEEKAEETVSFWEDEQGVGVIEVVLILVVLIGLVLVFKEQITGIVTNAFAKIAGDAGSIIK